MSVYFVPRQVDVFEIFHADSPKVSKRALEVKFDSFLIYVNGAATRNRRKRWQASSETLSENVWRDGSRSASASGRASGSAGVTSGVTCRCAYCSVVY
eukprot:1118230-Amorphochlora_amoeboformis.AAC.1